MAASDGLSAAGLTALGVAWARAVESHRPDRLFDDPLAAKLAQRARRELAQTLRGGAHGVTHSGPVDEETARAFLHYAAVRTRYFDDCLLEACAAGCRQVVILAAGMDARAFRLLWPTGTQLYELDRSDVLALKEDVIASEGLRARCQRHTVTADVTAGWAGALLAAGFAAGQQTAWLAEGLLAYLSPEDNDALIRTAGRLSGLGSTLALEVTRASALSHGPLSDLADRMAGFGAPWRSGVDDPAGWLAELGWQARVDNPFDVAGRYGRQLTCWPSPDQADEPIAWLVSATRA
ncbi:MAG TPA: SAM-dependent methyltransferase [Pseudonocardiaceae bacterium]|jgi:methyltransferase (TIGR00027 family)|nr:SAM-dependent methyltransferase [Pseudonocardiaceae bacterium]